MNEEDAVRINKLVTKGVHCAIVFFTLFDAAVPSERVLLDDGLVEEKIDFNERFTWTGGGWSQGRSGFGPNGNLRFVHSSNKAE